MLKKKKEMLKNKKSTTVLRKALFSLYKANILKLFNVFLKSRYLFTYHGYYSLQD